MDIKYNISDHLFVHIQSYRDRNYDVELVKISLYKNGDNTSRAHMYMDAADFSDFIKGMSHMEKLLPLVG